MIDAILSTRRTGRPAVPLCVCGHLREEHREVVMSVPMLAKTPTYKPVGFTACNVAHNTNPLATYVREECHCGCACWLPDT